MVDTLTRIPLQAMPSSISDDHKLGFHFLMRFSLILFLLFPSFSFANDHKEYLDSVAYEAMNGWIKSRGRKARVNFQFTFQYGDQYSFHGAIGQVSKKDKTNPLDFKYKSASVAKTFFAVMILQLAEEGMVDLEKPAATYLDSSIVNELVIADGKDYSYDMTVRQLLQHESGLTDYIFEDWKFMIRVKLFSGKSFEPEDHLETYRKHKMNRKNTFKPGEKFHYTDTGYLLLGLIIEAVTGKPVSEVIQTRIVEPLDLKDTYFDNWDSSYTHIMHQYYYKKDVTRKLHPSVEFGGGGLICSNRDLFAFIQGLFDLKLFKKQETLDDMIDVNEDGYGLGIERYRFPERWFKEGSTDSLYTYGHSGFFGVDMYHIPSKDITYVNSVGQSGRFEMPANPTWYEMIRACYKVFDND